MVYTKPQLLNVKKASENIRGKKRMGSQDSDNGDQTSSVIAYRNDE